MNNLPKRNGLGSNLRPFNRKSNSLTITPPGHTKGAKSKCPVGILSIRLWCDYAAVRRIGQIKNAKVERGIRRLPRDAIVPAFA